MKKFVIALISILAFTLITCQRETELPDQVSEKVEISLNIDLFTVEESSFGRTAAVDWTHPIDWDAETKMTIVESFGREAPKEYHYSYRELLQWRYYLSVGYTYTITMEQLDNSPSDKMRFYASSGEVTITADMTEVILRTGSTHTLVLVSTINHSANYPPVYVPDEISGLGYLYQEYHDNGFPLYEDTDEMYSSVGGEGYWYIYLPALTELAAYHSILVTDFTNPLGLTFAGVAGIAEIVYVIRFDNGYGQLVQLDWGGVFVHQEEFEIETNEGTNESATMYDIEDNKYRVVIIGDQIWMAENLKTTKLNDGTDIPLVTDDMEWGNHTTPAYCWYDNNKPTYSNTYGAHYNWYTVETGKLCPTGWHVPSDGEWTTLRDFLGGESVAGGKLKSNGTIEAGTGLWLDPNVGATNETRFTARPGAHREHDGWWGDLGNTGYWWSATGYYGEAWTFEMVYSSSLAYMFTYPKEWGFSVRCLKD